MPDREKIIKELKRCVLVTTKEYGKPEYVEIPYELYKDTLDLLKEYKQMDREKVIKGFKECMGKGKCTKCVYGKETPMLSCKELLWDALALLQDQKAVVRCKDCKNFDGLNCKVNDITNIMDTNWFCADGEKAVSE